MQSHGPCTLKGPVTQHREWWRRPKRSRLKAPREDGVVTGIRFELVQRIRREIAAGTYDTPEKLTMAIDRLIRRVNLD